MGNVNFTLAADIFEPWNVGKRLIPFPEFQFSLHLVLAESNARHKGEESEGVRGLKALGVRDLHYRMAFLACNVKSANRRFGDDGGGNHSSNNDDDVTPQAIKERMTQKEWDTTYQMSQEKDLYQKVVIVVTKKL